MYEWKQSLEYRLGYLAFNKCTALSFSISILNTEH